MYLGIPRGFFYYDYIEFIRLFFEGTDCELVIGKENDYPVFEKGMKATVDEACLPIKLFAGQIEELHSRCDRILIARIMKDCNGMFLCPKLLGLPELYMKSAGSQKLLVSEPMYFNSRSRLKRAMWHISRSLGIDRRDFERNFKRAYERQLQIALGKTKAHVEAAWEFTPQLPAKGEIVLPNTKEVFLAGHCYNVYDKFSNGHIMRKLDELGVGVITEKSFSQREKAEGMNSVKLIKTPYWESVERILGAVIYARNHVDGIVYLSSFSCGQDSIIIELLREHTEGIPLLVLKLDEHQASAGVDTRLEAFSDMLQRRNP